MAARSRYMERIASLRHQYCFPKLIEPTISGHFLHGQHTLLRNHHKQTIFTCNACGSQGRGTRYSCNACDFHLHTHCAHCPQTVSSPLHPQHNLKIKGLCTDCRKQILDEKWFQCLSCSMDFHKTCGVEQMPYHQGHVFYERGHGNMCNECRQECKAMFYRCDQCDFDLDPQCHFMAIGTTANQRAHDPSPETSTIYFFMHPEHQLMPSRVTDGPACPCEVCGDPVDADCFGCGPCKFHVHKHCALSVKPVVKDETHPAHMLHYLKTRANPCKVCGSSCLLWRYHCNICNVHVHRNCLKGQG